MLKELNELDDKIHEECGVIGIYSAKKTEVASLIYYGLYSLQHRGQEGSGMAVSNFHDFLAYKNIGWVGDVFNKEWLEKLNGIEPHIGIGHVRYATAGSKTVENVQPLVATTGGEKIAIALNGNLIDTDILKKKLESEGALFYTDSDCEFFINKFAREFNKTNDFAKAVKNVLPRLNGSFSLVAMTKDVLVGARDPYGIRPLCIGRLKNGGYVIASESCALDVIGATLVRDVKNGEIVYIDKKGLHSIIYDDKQKKQTCIFEYVYLARPDSLIDGISPYLSRHDQGRFLFKEHPLKADLVIAAPNSGEDAAMGYAHASGIPYGTGLIKNRYIARSFIRPTQQLREQDVHIKLNPLKVIVEGQDLILVDDSIVRGTTSMKLVRALKNAGAKKVYLLSASPKVKWPCFLGIDTTNRKELMAAKMTTEQMQEKIKCDYLGFLSLESLIKSCDEKQSFCTGCFDKNYPMKPTKIKKPVVKNKIVKNKKNKMEKKNANNL